MHVRQSKVTLAEQQAWESRERLERDREPHTMAKLPCCGSAVEITDPTKDNFVLCPNKLCRKRHVVLSGLSHKVVSEQQNARLTRNLSF